MIKTLLPISILMIFCSACNNQRINRVSADGYCYPDKDPAAYNLSKAEVDNQLFVPFTLSENEKFTVNSFATTLIIAGKNEEKYTVTLSGGASTEKTTTLSTSCTAGFNPGSATTEPVVFSLPVSNQDGSFSTLETTVEIGAPKEGEEQKFVRVKSKFIPAVKTDSSTTPPQSFASYFDGASDSMSMYVLKAENDDKENGPQTFFLHHKNEARSAGLISITTRFSLKKASKN